MAEEELKVKHVSYNDDEGTFHEENDELKDPNDLVDTPEAKKLMKCFCLSIAYAASIGGIGSLVGTAPNILLKGYFDTKYPNGGLNFLTYMAFALPISVIMIFFAWIIMTFIWLPKSVLFFWKKKKSTGPDQLKLLIERRYQNLGPWSFEQKSVLFLFILCITLWLTRELFVVDGWSYFFGSKKYVSDTTPAIFIVILTFIWPKKNIFLGHKYEHLLKWKDMINFPWEVILLGGGSLAIAEAFDKSGLSNWVGDFLAKALPKHKILALIIILVVCETGTEFTSNTSMASIFIPIIDSLAEKNDILPHYFLLPMIGCVSFAFMFPVATPPNAIVFGSGYLKLKDMIISGIFMNIIGIIVLLLAANVWLYPIFSNAKFNNHLNGSFPSLSTNKTL